jgi:hypothetical protein
MQSMMGSLRSSSAGAATWFVLAAMPALASPLTSVSTSGQISGVCGPAFSFLVDSHPSAPSQVNLVDGIANLTNPPLTVKREPASRGSPSPTSQCRPFGRPLGGPGDRQRGHPHRLPEPGLRRQLQRSGAARTAAGPGHLQHLRELRLRSALRRRRRRVLGSPTLRGRAGYDDGQARSRIAESR